MMPLPGTIFYCSIQLMFKNYFKTTLRNLWKNRTYSFLNIAGLAIGVACAGIIFLWMEDELNYDNVFLKKDRLYYIQENQTYDGITRTFGATPVPFAPAIKAELPGIANTCRTLSENYLFSMGEQSVFENGCYADSSVFSMFTLQFVQGKAANALQRPDEIVISEKMAGHFFRGEKNVIGKLLRVNNAESMIVSGVIKDLPENSTLHFNWIASFDNYLRHSDNATNWRNNCIVTYAELQPTASAASINKQLYNFIKKKDAGAIANPFLFSMNDWRLRSRFEDGKQAGGRIEYIRLFAVIAWIILVIACINFMNLSTARSEKRAREVGVRKVLGAGRKLLLLQFMGEALMMSVLAVLLGAVMIWITLPFFNLLVEKQLVLALNRPLHCMALLMIALLCGLVSGSYPALYLSSFNPVHVFKSVSLRASGAAFIRKGLVVLQFTVSIVLIVSTIVIYQQVQHVKSRDLGYNRDNLLVMDMRGDMQKNFAAIKQDMLNTGAVENVALNSFNTLDIGNNGGGLSWEGKDPGKDILLSFRQISPEFIATAGLQIAEGRGFNAGSIAADSSNVLITESLARMMGKGSAVGKILREDDQAYKVIGVVKDFVYGDMYGQSDPVVFFCNPKEASLMYVRIKNNVTTEAALAKIGAVMRKDNPAYPFEYNFVDDQFNALFKSEMLIGKRNCRAYLPRWPSLFPAWVYLDWLHTLQSAEQKK